MMLNKVFPDQGPTYYGFLMSVNAITVIVLTIFIISLTKRFKPLVNIIFSGIFYMVGFGMIWVIHSFWLYAISTALWTIGEILNMTNFGVYIANNSPKNFRARFNAVSSLSFSLGSTLGSSVMGAYVDYAGLDAVWPLVFVL
jgi:MFS family permease